MRVAQAAILILVFWLVLAAPVSLSDLAWGLLVAVLVGGWAAASLWALDSPRTGLRRLAGIFYYTLELLRSIVPAALQVTSMIMQPKMPLKPVVIRHRMRASDELSRMALANSITLTPGTHCVDIEDDVLTIHCLEPHFAEPVQDGTIERRIARVLGTGDDS